MTFLTAYLHDLDPFAIRLWDDFGIRWYGLAYVGGFIAAYLVLRELSKRGRTPLSVQGVGDMLMAGVIGVLAGGRLGWVLFYHPEALWTFSSSAPFWEVLAINRGGMASHGGIIGVILAMTWFARRQGVSPLHVLDIAALVTPFGLFFGRLANFVNGELWGVPCDPDYPLAVKFPQEITSDAWGPDRMAELSNLAPQFGMTAREWMATVAGAGTPSGANAFYELKARVQAAVQAGVDPVVAAVEPLITPRHPSQLYQAFAEGIVLLSLLWLFYLLVKPKRHGAVGCAFVLGYGVLRVITELWRVPDEGIERVIGLSRGQWLSVGMIVFGLGALVWLLRREPRPAVATTEVAASAPRDADAESSQGTT